MNSSTDKTASLRAILIAGPTASGKSSFALALAKKHGGCIINADSMQVYRELSILTARPSAEEAQNVPHHLYGFLSAARAYSVGQWLEDIKIKLAECERRNIRPIIVGGTGLYFKALLEGLAPIEDISDEVREKWRQKAQDLGAEKLYALLKDMDPELAATLKPGDTQRIARGLEVFEQTGRSLLYWQQQPAQPVLLKEQVQAYVICPAREELYRRIELRLDQMLEMGALEEVRSLAKLNLDPALPAMRALGVAPLSLYLESKISREEALAQAKQDTRRYAKRQMTWLRKHMSDWLSYSSSIDAQKQHV